MNREKTWAWESADWNPWPCSAPPVVWSGQVLLTSFSLGHELYKKKTLNSMTWSFLPALNAPWILSLEAAMEGLLRLWIILKKQHSSPKSCLYMYSDSALKWALDGTQFYLELAPCSWGSCTPSVGPTPLSYNLMLKYILSMIPFNSAIWGTLGALVTESSCHSECNIWT